jgi:hypothetical protein
VTVSEVVTLLNIALGSADFERCRPGDADYNGVIEIGDLLRAVNNLINGCPAL